MEEKKSVSATRQSRASCVAKDERKESVAMMRPEIGATSPKELGSVSHQRFWDPETTVCSFWKSRGEARRPISKNRKELREQNSARWCVKKGVFSHTYAVLCVAFADCRDERRSRRRRRRATPGRPLEPHLGRQRTPAPNSRYRRRGCLLRLRGTRRRWRVCRLPLDDHRALARVNRPRLQAVPTCPQPQYRSCISFSTRNYGTFQVSDS